MQPAMTAAIHLCMAMYGYVWLDHRGEHEIEIEIESIDA